MQTDAEKKVADEFRKSGVGMAEEQSAKMFPPAKVEEKKTAKVKKVEKTEKPSDE